jgi:hypothetical protein
MSRSPPTGYFPSMGNPTIRLWMNAFAVSGVFVILLELAIKHHESNKLSTQVAAGVLIWLLLANAGALGILWRRGRRPVGRSQIVLSLAIGLDVWIPVALYPRHPNTRPVASRAFAAVILVLLSAVLIWASLWGAAWVIQRARPGGGGRRELLGSRAASLTIAGAASVIIALNASGFDSRHAVLLVCLSVLVWLAIALVLRVLIVLIWSLRARNRPVELSR